MQKKIFFVLIWIIGIVSFVTISLLYTQFDPSNQPHIASIFMFAAVFLFLVCVLTIILFSIKKTIMRGHVLPYMQFSSLRQSILCTVFVFSLYFFDRYIFTYSESMFLNGSVIFLVALILLSIEAVIIKIER